VTDKGNEVALIVAQAMADYQVQQPPKKQPKISLQQGTQMVTAILDSLEKHGYVIEKKTRTEGNME
jgi:hypothetical protein